MTDHDETTTLYRFYDKDDRLLYVGITNNFGARFSHHSNLKAWWEDVARSSMEHFPNRKAALAAERAAIVAERPRFNIVHNPARPRKPERAREPVPIPLPATTPPAPALVPLALPRRTSYEPLDTR